LIRALGNPCPDERMPITASEWPESRRQSSSFLKDSPTIQNPKPLDFLNL
jgi:hypothetical protein